MKIQIPKEWIMANAHKEEGLSVEAGAPILSSAGLAGTDLVGSLEKVYFAAVEFLNDWKKGDFALPSLAQHDANALKEACLRYESEKAAFLKRCHETIDARSPA